MYEPGMLTPSGLTGEDDSEELLLTASVQKTLAAAGHVLVRHNLFDNPLAFINNSQIANLLRQSGDDGFPAVCVNDELVMTGRYPTLAEWIEFLEEPDLEAELLPMTETELAQIREDLKTAMESGCSSGGCANCSGCGN